MAIISLLSAPQVHINTSVVLLNMALVGDYKQRAAEQITFL